MTNLLVIIPCGQSKIWRKEPNHGPSKAKDAYIGPPFKVNKEFAEKFADKWMILSAKYGFIDPDFVIPADYNVTFKKPATNPISIDALKEQIRKRNLQAFENVIALGGKDYSSKVKLVFGQSAKVYAPTQGFRLGIGMQRINSLMKLGKAEMLKKVIEQNERRRGFM